MGTWTLRVDTKTTLTAQSLRHLRPKTIVHETCAPFRATFLTVQPEDKSVGPMDFRVQGLQLPLLLLLLLQLLLLLYFCSYTCAYAFANAHAYSLLLLLLRLPTPIFLLCMGMLQQLLLLLRRRRLPRQRQPPLWGHIPFLKVHWSL